LGGLLTLITTDISLTRIFTDLFKNTEFIRVDPCLKRKFLYNELTCLLADEENVPPPLSILAYLTDFDKNPYFCVIP